jgi:signal transduction histidine kinase/ligand-binding sensor domain-containing protein
MNWSRSWLLSLLLASAALGKEPAQYFSRVWRSNEGLPSDSVAAVVQTRDGYLWLGTRSGLARFDGVRFVTFDSSNTAEMRSLYVTCLFEAADGALWIGHDTGDLTCYSGGKFHAVPIHANWSGGKIFAIAADKAGDIWLLNEQGELLRVKDGFVIPASPDHAIHLLTIARNPGGGFWIQRDNEVSALENTSLRPLDFDMPGTNHYVQGIAASRDGGLWVMIERRMRKWKDNAWGENYGEAPWDWSPVHTTIETQDGKLAAATASHGLFLTRPGNGAIGFSRANGLSTDWITSVCEDREGNLWAGTGNGGLLMVRRANIRTVLPPDGFQGRSVLSVACSSDDTLWIGTEGAGLYAKKGSQWTHFDQGSGLLHQYIWSALPGPDGRIKVGTWGNGLYVQNAKGFEPVPGFANFVTPIGALCEGAHGRLWIGTSEGLMRLADDKLETIADKSNVTSPDVRTICEAPDGTVWFGMSGGGLACWNKGALRQFRRTDGLSSDFVQCLHLEPDGDLWIGTLAGLNRFRNGRFTVVDKNHGLVNDMICDVRDDGLGFFWISSHGGLLRVNKDELNQCADGKFPAVRCLTYTLSDGLRTLEFSGGFQPASGKTSDGHLWFPTSQGLVEIDPHTILRNPLAPPVLIEQLLVDDQPVHRPAGESPMRIAPGRHRFEFQFTALSFAAPEKVCFRYRLKGLESQWVELVSPRRAYYSHLPPGDYQFDVLASNNDGVWNETGATFAFTVLPFFWQTWWFRLVGVVFTAAASGMVVWMLGRRRLRRELEQLERKQMVERERARIARDIHDDLGARLTRISLLSESVPQEDVHPPQAADVLNRIFITARETTRAMDEIVWAVNPQHDTLDSLASYLGKFAQEFFEDSLMRCRLDIPMQLPNWPLDAEIRHNLFLAFKESLNNALCHSKATEVLVSLALDDRSFSITVADNGIGFDHAPTLIGSSNTAPRNGLKNMRHRLKHIGGVAEIRSTPGTGTRVCFRFDPGNTHRGESRDPKKHQPQTQSGVLDSQD